MRSTSIAAALLTGLFAVSAALESFAEFGGGTPGGSARAAAAVPTVGSASNVPGSR